MLHNRPINRPLMINKFINGYSGYGNKFKLAFSLMLAFSFIKCQSE